MTEFQWDWAFTFEILPELISAFLRVTLTATIGGMAIALVVGMVFALLRRSHIKWVSLPTGFLVEFLRSTPLLVQIFFLYFVLPNVGIVLDPPFLLAVVALGMHYSAYTSEIYRSGIDGVDNGQWEAARALNFSQQQTWTKIILPQAMRRVIPPLGNRFIAMFKDTPMLMVVGLVEVLAASKEIASDTFRTIEPYTLVGLLFLVASLASAGLVRLLEGWLAIPGVKQEG